MVSKIVRLSQSKSVVGAISKPATGAILHEGFHPNHILISKFDKLKGRYLFSKNQRIQHAVIFVVIFVCVIFVVVRRWYELYTARIQSF